MVTSRMDDQSKLFTLNGILKDAELLLGDDGRVYANIVRDGRPVMYATSSAEFMTWIKGRAVERLSDIPGTKILKQAIEEAEYGVRIDNTPVPVVPRIFAEGDTIWINRGEGKTLLIDAEGAVPSGDGRFVFPTQAGMCALPDPEQADVMEVLPEILGLDESQCLRVLIWLMALLQAEGRYPLLIITGSAQSGKTRLATNIRKVLDPSAMPLLPLPKKKRELLDAVAANWILAFDNVREVPLWLAEDILSLSEGTVLPSPDGGEPLQRKAATILVCDEIPDAPDLVQNAVILRLKERPAPEFLDKSALDQKFVRAHAKAFGSLVHLAVQALVHLPQIQLDNVYRDAALEKWLIAIDHALGLRGKLLATLHNNSEEVLVSILNDTPALRAFLEMLKVEGSVKATASDILAQLGPFVKGPKGARWPTSGKALAALLRRHKRLMTDVEIEFDVRTGKNRDRNIVASLKPAKVGDEAYGGAPQASKRVTKTKKGSDKAPDQLRLV